MRSQTQITAYVGAYPNGRPAPNLEEVPVSTDSNFSFIFCLAFARDLNRDGNFSPVWDSQITPGYIQQLTSENPNRKFYASLGGGDNFPWQAPSDEGAWVNNAVSSLTNMMSTYSLAGFDIDYENNLDDSFVRCMSQVMSQMAQHCQWSCAPFGATNDIYQRLWTSTSFFLGCYNYQAYADGINDQQGYENVLASVGQSLTVNGTTFGNVGLGIASSTSSPRGLQLPDILTVWENVHATGVSSVAIWCLEDSAENGYAIENAIQGNS